MANSLRSRSLFSMLFAALAIVAVPFFAFVRLVGDFVLSAIVPNVPLLASDGGSGLFTGQSLNAALQNGLRHEANVSRRSADRKI